MTTGLRFAYGFLSGLGKVCHQPIISWWLRLVFFLLRILLGILVTYKNRNCFFGCLVIWVSPGIWTINNQYEATNQHQSISLITSINHQHGPSINQPISKLPPLPVGSFEDVDPLVAVMLETGLLVPKWKLGWTKLSWMWPWVWQAGWGWDVCRIKGWFLYIFFRMESCFAVLA